MARRATKQGRKKIHTNNAGKVRPEVMRLARESMERNKDLLKRLAAMK